MTIQGYQFDKMKVTPESDAALFSYLAQGLDNKVFKGMTATVSGLNVYIETGKALVQGRFVEVTQQHQLSAQANTSGYVVITIDLTQSNTATGTPGTGNYLPINNQLRLELVETLNQQDLSAGGVIYTLPIYTYSSTGTSATLTKYKQSFKQPDYISAAFGIGFGVPVTAKRIGNVVTITFRGQNTSQIPSGTKMNEKIPLGYRPIEVESVDFLTVSRHLDNYYYFDPDGSINYTGEAIPINSFFRGVRSYLTRDPWPI